MAKLWVLSALMVVLGCGESAESATCPEQRKAFDELVAANQQCASASECRVVGFTRIDCSGGTDFVRGVHMSVASDAQGLLKDMQDCLPTSVDDFDRVEAICDDGVCGVEYTREMCFFPPPDAAPPDAGPLDAAPTDAGPLDAAPADGAQDRSSASAV